MRKPSKCHKFFNCELHLYIIALGKYCQMLCKFLTFPVMH
mgnify:CR=1 FL=1